MGRKPTKGPAVAPPPVPEREVQRVAITPSPPSETQSVKPAPPAFAIDQQAARLGVVWAEILGAPRARRPWEAKGTEPFASRLKPSP